MLLTKSLSTIRKPYVTWIWPYLESRKETYESKYELKGLMEYYIIVWPSVHDERCCFFMTEETIFSDDWRKIWQWNAVQNLSSPTFFCMKASGVACEVLSKPCAHIFKTHKITFHLQIFKQKINSYSFIHQNFKTLFYCSTIESLFQLRKEKVRIWLLTY